MRRLILGLAMTFLSSCTRPNTAQFSGNTMGTIYQVTYAPAEGSDRQVDRAVAALLEEINHSLSTYTDASVISRVNASTDTTAWNPVDVHFANVFRAARSVYKDTNGVLNPAVGPLVNAWGFGPKAPPTLPDEAKVQALLKLISFDRFELRDSPPGVRKPFPDSQLDFNAITEGYAIDGIGALLEKNGINDYLIELGGEVRARGRRPDGKGWRVGIERPAENALAARQLQTVLLLDNAALATSGRYRNYIVEDGAALTHILDPRTGRPTTNSLLSVSVLAHDAIRADAYATSLMVMGLDDGLRFVEDREDLEAYFIAKDAAGNLIEKRSSGFPKAADE